ncbi:uncharacterized protein LOC115213356 [Octopus sinensis]|uniref:Uncharacterized protein LOC115213356 n=1 Tax=Octopus sinensis TaxID=2607531 RepID=A0A6P7SJK3_9MOLL|nr:uncharacterized protein LOC115213356 [Octopus sinensis]
MSKLFYKLSVVSSTGLIPRSINYFSTLCRNLPSSLTNGTNLLPTTSAAVNPSHETILSQNDQNPAVLQQSVRCKKIINYKPNVWKRIHMNSLHKRILTKGGIETIWKRLLKGRHVLVPYDGFLFDKTKKTKHSLTQPKIYRENRFIKKEFVKKKSFLDRPSTY